MRGSVNVKNGILSIMQYLVSAGKLSSIERRIPIIVALLHLVLALVLTPVVDVDATSTDAPAYPAVRILELRLSQGGGKIPDLDPTYPPYSIPFGAWGPGIRTF